MNVAKQNGTIKAGVTRLPEMLLNYTILPTVLTREHRTPMTEGHRPSPHGTWNETLHTVVASQQKRTGHGTDTTVTRVRNDAHNTRLHTTERDQVTPSVVHRHRPLTFLRIESVQIQKPAARPPDA